MKAAAFHIPFFIMILFILQTHKAQPNNNTTKLTDEFIHKICSKTRKPPFCQKILESSKANTSLSSLPVFARYSMDMASRQADANAKLIRDFYHGTPIQERGTRTMYHTCGMIYAVDVKKRIAKANECMAECMLLTGDYAKCVKKWFEVALKRVDANCSKPLKKTVKQPRGRQVAAKIRQANDAFLDFCSVVLAVCKEVKCKR